MRRDIRPPGQPFGNRLVLVGAADQRTETIVGEARARIGDDIPHHAAIAAIDELFVSAISTRSAGVSRGDCASTGLATAISSSLARRRITLEGALEIGASRSLSSARTLVSIASTSIPITSSKILGDLLVEVARGDDEEIGDASQRIGALLVRSRREGMLELLDQRLRALCIAGSCINVSPGEPGYSTLF